MEKKYSVLIKVDVGASDQAEAAAKGYQALLANREGELSFIVVDAEFRQTRLKMSVDEAKKHVPPQTAEWDVAVDDDELTPSLSVNSVEPNQSGSATGTLVR